jgi:hypothetical protein
MQRFALSENGKRVFAEEAFPQVDYFCPECLSPLRLKRGEVKVAHFFHLEGTRECRWKTRFQVHTTIQESIAEKLGETACTLECFFPEISRIADIAYHPEKIVFEIQVSPISDEEVKKRTEDYWRVGWHVIWILHVDQFGRKKACAAESFLEGIPHYFVLLFDRGQIQELRIFDECSFVYKKRRRWFLPLSRENVSAVSPCTFFTPPQRVEGADTYFENAICWFQYRKKTWSCSLQGDILSKGVPKNVTIPSPFVVSFRKEDVCSFFARIRTFLFLLWLQIVGAK